jgi:hypothetical protein
LNETGENLDENGEETEESRRYFMCPSFVDRNDSEVDSPKPDPAGGGASSSGSSADLPSQLSVVPARVGAIAVIARIFYACLR